MEKDKEYYENLDKRTNEYKEWKKRFEADNKGLGDVVETITKATGIKKVVEFIAGEDCGCDERKEKLNNLRFRATPKCFNEDEYNFLRDLYESNRAVSRPDLETLVDIECRIFNKRYSGPICGNCGDAQRIIRDMKEIYENYA